jgi:outer membrane protein TolC
VDVLQQSSVLAETESLVPPTEALLRVSENRLDVLIGKAPDAVDRVDDDDRFVAILVTCRLPVFPRTCCSTVRT